MNEEQLKLIQDSLKTIQQTIKADLAKEAHTQRTKLDTLQSKLNKPDTHGLRGKHTLCIICFEPTAIPTHRMPCCRQFIHEECLLQCFRHSPFHQGYRCPHCRGDFFPVDADDLTAETHPSPGHYLYIFNYSSMGTLQHDVEEIAYDLFINPPLAPRPPGLNWDQVRAEREAQLRDLLGIDVNQDN